MANRFKSKRSESVVTQRPPEISSSRNALTNPNQRTANKPATQAVSGASSTKHGKSKSKGSNMRNVTSRGKASEIPKYVTQPIQYVLPHAKNSSALGHFSGSNIEPNPSQNTID